MAQPVVIVSNRLPISVKKVDGRLEFYPSVGGLATGLASYVNDRRNKWIGWPGIASDDLSEAERQQIAVELRKSNCYPVFLKQKQLDDFYNGYSNSILWPLFHDMPAHLEDHDKYWKAYKAVNASFAGVVLALSEPRSTIWVHDYQLMLVPALIKAVRLKAKIGFFLHIPFPSAEHFASIPSAKQLLGGVLGADLVGMHIRSYTDNFLAACASLTKSIVDDGQVIHGAYSTRVTDFPMGIDYDRFTKARDLAAVKRELKKHQRKYKGLKVILTVDRMEPSKGLVERLEAYHEFLRRTPALRGKVIMVMLAVPSRTDVKEYIELRQQVEALIDKTTRQFGTRKWQPVDYMFTAIPVESVTALYQVADVAFITPLRDGMNLVAKEYIASKPKHDGVLILSSTAGAAQELTDALLVNPTLRESLVRALNDAIGMPKGELKQRLSAMHKHIATNTVQSWASGFMKSLQQPLPGNQRLTRALTHDRELDIIEVFKRARHPVVLLDYDGVLAPHVMTPSRATPTKSLDRILAKLTEHNDIDVAVISGRSQEELTEWLGNLPVSLVAEHGAMMRFAAEPAISGRRSSSTGQRSRKLAAGCWKRITNVSPAWQDDVQPILEKYAANTPGASVEVKNFSLVWHYRGASPYYSQKHLVILRRLLRPLARQYGLGVYNGNKILEIKPLDVNKGTAVQQLLAGFAADTSPSIDFILCIGDDYTDEDMFEALPASSYTIKVGRGYTTARYRTTGVEEVQSLLKKLAK